MMFEENLRIRKYTTKKGSQYKNLKNGNWISQKELKGIKVLGPSTYVSQEKFDELTGKYVIAKNNKSVSRTFLDSLIKEGKEEGYKELEGRIITLILQGKNMGIRWSSKVISIDPPFNSY